MKNRLGFALKSLIAVAGTATMFMAAAAETFDSYDQASIENNPSMNEFR